ncbi:hypothetical protein LTR04_004765 [Oleoguttula sp. CCFEE 6159]|nr:hypothetical protein LTR04_004765 [Oleoguttula sp. CCFEE 6159]
MPADRLLGTLLRSLQTYTDQQDTPRLLSTAASLLTTLTNPLNTTLLVVQLLTAPAIWDRPEGLQTCLQCMGVFHSAAIAVIKHEAAVRENGTPASISGQVPTAPRLPLEDWVRAVVKGANERSERWRHLLVLGGLLIGLDSSDYEGVYKGLRRTLEEALVKAANLALEGIKTGDELGGYCIALVLNHSFGLLSDSERVQLDYDRLLPVLIGSAFFSSEGFQSAYFLGVVDQDVAQVLDGKFGWSSKSTSYHQVERILSRPLVSSMGPLSRLTAHAVENVKDAWLIQMMMEDLAGFTRTMTVQWRLNKLSEIEPSEEQIFLHEDAVWNTLPKLWRVLKSAMFAIVIVLRGVMGRIIGDAVLAADGVAPVLVTQTLHTLRNLYFVSSRLGSSSFSQYTFTYLTAIDVLTNYPLQADAFLKHIKPVELGQIPQHPLDRCLDLFFLNTAEHFTLVLSPQTNEDLLVAAATPYLAAGGNNRLLHIFEAAHSVMLAVISAPQSAELTAKHLPFYVDALFKVFPTNLSPRQFRLAFKTLLTVTTPPSPISASQPLLPSTLLELLHHRALTAPVAPLRADPASPAPATVDVAAPPLSEQAVLVLTLLDVLPSIPVATLEEWLPLSAALVNAVPDAEMREHCQLRFWETLNAGHMDPERSQLCVAWWNSRGGREAVLYGREGGMEVAGEGQGSYLMSGALPDESGRSKL